MELNPVGLILSLVNFILSIIAFTQLEDDLPEVIRNQNCSSFGRDPYLKFEIYQYVFPIFFTVFSVGTCCGLAFGDNDDQKVGDAEFIQLMFTLGLFIFNAMTIADLNISDCTNPPERPIQLVEDHLNFWFFTLIWPWCLLSIVIVIYIGFIIFMVIFGRKSEIFLSADSSSYV